MGGTGLLGVLGTGARIALWYPGARKPDRLLLAGREETRFGQSGSAHQATARQQQGNREGTIISAEISIRSR
jgi:hypothetical protein